MIASSRTFRGSNYIIMHAIVYNKSPSLLINPVCHGDGVCMHHLRVPPDPVSWADRKVRYTMNIG